MSTYGQQPEFPDDREEESFDAAGRFSHELPQGDILLGNSRLFRDITEPLPVIEPEPPDPGLDPVHDGPRVRPYARTGGRTSASADLAIESLLVAAGSAPRHELLTADHRMIRDICVQAKSVAEVAAYGRLPIGGARVIIADMLELGLLELCSPELVAGSPSVDLMARVLSGLRGL